MSQPQASYCARWPVAIWPVLDLRQGQAVHAIAGRRHLYQPVVSQLTSSPAPHQLAQALLQAAHSSNLYVADLDGILEGQPQWPLLEKLLLPGITCWLDAGPWTTHVASQWLAHAGTGVVLGLESFTHPDHVEELLRLIPPDRVIISLDLRDGRPMTGPNWPDTALGVAEQLLAWNIQRLLVLDVADVGLSGGGSTHRLVRTLRDRAADLWLLVGGGVRNQNDLQRWHETGANAVLVATALHQQRLQP